MTDISYPYLENVPVHQLCCFEASPLWGQFWQTHPAKSLTEVRQGCVTLRLEPYLIFTQEVSPGSSSTISPQRKGAGYL